MDGLRLFDTYSFLLSTCDAQSVGEILSQIEGDRRLADSAKNALAFIAAARILLARSVATT